MNSIYKIQQKKYSVLSQNIHNMKAKEAKSLARLYEMRFNYKYKKNVLRIQEERLFFSQMSLYDELDALSLVEVAKKVLGKVVGVAQNQNDREKLD